MEMLIVLQNSHNQVLTRLVALEAEHVTTHNALEAARITIAGLERQTGRVGGSYGGSSKEFRLIDPKTMVPERLAGTPMARMVGSYKGLH